MDVQTCMHSSIITANQACHLQPSPPHTLLSMRCGAKDMAPPGSLDAYAVLAGQALPVLAPRMDAGLRQAFCEARNQNLRLPKPVSHSG